ncbi:MAG: hypothetical protein R3C14_08950 [Caldilineaceae bacterium]
MNIPGNYRSHLFTLRLWTEPGVLYHDGKPSEIRFKVQHLLSGEVRYFREWPALIEFLVAIVEDAEDDPSHCQRPTTNQ